MELWPISTFVRQHTLGFQKLVRLAIPARTIAHKKGLVTSQPGLLCSIHCLSQLTPGMLTFLVLFQTLTLLLFLSKDDGPNQERGVSFDRHQANQYAQCQRG